MVESEQEKQNAAALKLLRRFHLIVDAYRRLVDF